MRMYVDIDVCDVLSELETEDLERELDRRRKRGMVVAIRPDDIIGPKDAYQSLDDAAFALRKIDKVNLAYRLDEIRHDYFRTAKP